MLCMYTIPESAPFVAVGEDSADRSGPQHRHIPKDIGGRRAHGPQTGRGENRHIH